MSSRTNEAPLPSPGQELPLPSPSAELRSKLNAFAFPPKTPLLENGNDPTTRPGNVPSLARASTKSPTQDPIRPSGPKHIIILGAGIIGLQTALTILSSEETKRFKVTIIAEHTPSDHDPDYISPLAGGNWCSHVGMTVHTGLAASATDLRTLELQNFDLDTYLYWNRLFDSWTQGTIDQAKLDSIPSGSLLREQTSDDQVRRYHAVREKIEARSGLGWRMARYYWGKHTTETTYKDGSWIWWLERVEGSTLNAMHEKLKRRLEDRADGTFELRLGSLELLTHAIDAWEHWPDQAIWGISYRSICFDPDKYLKWVMRQVNLKGGKVIKTKVAMEGGLEGVVRGAKEILLDKLSQGENAEYYEVPEDDVSSNGEPEKSPSSLKRLSGASAKSIKKILSFTSRESSRSSEDGSRRKSSGTQTTDQNASLEELVGDPDIVAIVNCTGGSARHFVGDAEKSLMYPVRGQTILVKGSARQCRTYVRYPDALDEEMLYVIPRPGTNTTVLGGCKQVKSWDNELETEADEELNKRIIEGVKRFKLAEDLRTGPGSEFEIIDEYEDGSKRCSVGFSPGRDGGPRVELERENGGMVDGTYVLHNYGHSGGGFQSSVGCAEKIRKLIVVLERDL